MLQSPSTLLAGVEPTRAVHGIVRQPDGTPIPGAQVQAFDQELRSQTALGQARTGADGQYVIRYAIAQIEREGKTSADLVVKALQADGTVLAQSPVHFHAPADEEIDLTEGNQPYVGPSELALLQKQLAPALQQVAPADLTAHDIDYLTGETGASGDQVQRLAVVSKNAATIGIDPAILYALASQGLPSDSSSLLACDPAALRDALTAAVAENRVPAAVGGQINAVITKLQSAAISQMLAPGAYRVGSVLTKILPQAAQQTAFLSAFLANRESPVNFWQALGKQPGFDPATIAATQFAIQASSLTQYHAPLVLALVAQRQQGRIKSLSDLARLQASDWVQLLNTADSTGSPIGVPPGVPGDSAAVQAQNYAEILTRRLEVAFPTVAVSAGLSRSARAGAAEVGAFLDAHPDFDIAGTNAVTYVAARQASATVSSQLPAIQRIFRVAPRYAQMDVLLGAGLHSARGISMLSPNAFVSRFGAALGGEDEARAVYSRAQLFSASAAHLFGRFSSGLNQGRPIVIEDVT